MKQLMANDKACPACGGNDRDRPCAYPSEGQKGCLRDIRLARWRANAEVRELIIALRGGPPDKCDFCGNMTLPDNLHPEEAGEWICNDCIKRLG